MKEVYVCVLHNKDSAAAADELLTSPGTVPIITTMASLTRSRTAISILLSMSCFFGSAV